MRSWKAKNITAQFNTISKEESQRCFHLWKTRWNMCWITSEQLWIKLAFHLLFEYKMNFNSFYTPHILKKKMNISLIVYCCLGKYRFSFDTFWKYIVFWKKKKALFSTHSCCRGYCEMCRMYKTKFWGSMCSSQKISQTKQNQNLNNFKIKVYYSDGIICKGTHNVIVVVVVVVFGRLSSI